MALHEDTPLDRTTRTLLLIASLSLSAVVAVCLSVCFCRGSFSGSTPHHRRSYCNPPRCPPPCTPSGCTTTGSDAPISIYLSIYIEVLPLITTPIHPYIHHLIAIVHSGSYRSFCGHSRRSWRSVWWPARTTSSSGTSSACSCPATDSSVSSADSCSHLSTQTSSLRRYGVLL
jgi:hypothetical protein